MGLGQTFGRCEIHARLRIRAQPNGSSSSSSVLILIAVNSPALPPLRVGSYCSSCTHTHTHTQIQDDPLDCFAVRLSVMMMLGCLFLFFSFFISPLGHQRLKAKESSEWKAAFKGSSLQWQLHKKWMAHLYSEKSLSHFFFFFFLSAGPLYSAPSSSS